MDTINLDCNYFYMPFGPNTFEPQKAGLIYDTGNGLFFQKSSNSYWRKVLLYSTGWGRPNGFERLPELSFPALLTLALETRAKMTHLRVFEADSNRFGAIAIIMDRHIPELIHFLEENLNNKSFFDNTLHRRYLRFFCFDSKFCRVEGGSDGKTYEAILDEYDNWRRISSEVKKLIYG
jgi:hypothetical protein